jgi:hypothetical protein
VDDYAERVVVLAGAGGALGAGLAASFSQRVPRLSASTEQPRMAQAPSPESGISVNAVVPSIIDTSANRAAMPDADFGAWPTIADIAPVCLFLASPGGVRVSGAALPV